MATYDARKRTANLTKHGINLAACEPIFDAPMLTREDMREAYGEERFQSLRWLYGRVVVLVWTERDAGPHLISCRYGNKHEAERYFQAFL